MKTVFFIPWRFFSLSQVETFPKKTFLFYNIRRWFYTKVYWEVADVINSLFPFLLSIQITTDPTSQFIHIRTQFYLIYAGSTKYPQIGLKHHIISYSSKVPLWKGQKNEAGILSNLWISLKSAKQRSRCEIFENHWKYLKICEIFEKGKRRSRCAVKSPKSHCRGEDQCASASPHIIVPTKCQINLQNLESIKSNPLISSYRQNVK